MRQKSRPISSWKGSIDCNNVSLCVVRASYQPEPPLCYLKHISGYYLLCKVVLSRICMRDNPKNIQFKQR